MAFLYLQHSEFRMSCCRGDNKNSTCNTVPVSGTLEKCIMTDEIIACAGCVMEHDIIILKHEMRHRSFKLRHTHTHTHTSMRESSVANLTTFLLYLVTFLFSHFISKKGTNVATYQSQTGLHFQWCVKLYSYGVPVAHLVEQLKEDRSKKVC